MTYDPDAPCQLCGSRSHDDTWHYCDHCGGRDDGCTCWALDQGQPARRNTVCVDLDDPKAVEKLEELTDLLKRQRDERLEKLMTRIDQPALGYYRAERSR